MSYIAIPTFSIDNLCIYNSFQHITDVVPTVPAEPHSSVAVKKRVLESEMQVSGLSAKKVIFY